MSDCPLRSGNKIIFKVNSHELVLFVLPEAPTQSEAPYLCKKGEPPASTSNPFPNGALSLYLFNFLTFLFVVPSFLFSLSFHFFLCFSLFFPFLFLAPLCDPGGPEPAKPPPGYAPVIIFIDTRYKPLAIPWILKLFNLPTN